MNEFDLFADGRFDNVNRLLNRRGNQGKIDGSRKVIDRRICLDAVNFSTTRVNGIESAGKTVCLQDLEIGQLPSPRLSDAPMTATLSQTDGTECAEKRKDGTRGQRRFRLRRLRRRQGNGMNLRRHPDGTQEGCEDEPTADRNGPNFHIAGFQNATKATWLSSGMG